MKLQIDFYEKDEVSVLIEFDSSETYSDKDALELLLFAWFTLRQFHNLGHNPAVDAFAGLLIWEEAVAELMRDHPVVPSAIDLLVEAHRASLGEEDPLVMALAAIHIRSRLQDDSVVDTINRDYLSKIPQIVDCRDQPGDRQFIANVPPFTLWPKGFGVLGSIVGWRMNYYASHSIVALLRFLARKHPSDEPYLKRLSLIAQSCAKAHMQRVISWEPHQRELAALIVKASEEIERKAASGG